LGGSRGCGSKSCRPAGSIIPTALSQLRCLSWIFYPIFAANQTLTIRSGQLHVQRSHGHFTFLFSLPTRLRISTFYPPFFCSAFVVRDIANVDIKRITANLQPTHQFLGYAVVFLAADEPLSHTVSQRIVQCASAVPRTIIIICVACSTIVFSYATEGRIGSWFLLSTSVEDFRPSYHSTSIS